MNLDLDLYEATQISEDNTTDCILCKHNVEYLTHIQDSLVSTTNKKHMYEVMYKVFTRRMDALKKQNYKYIEVPFEQFCNHYDKHTLNLRKIITSDIRIVRQMQTQLLKKAIGKNGLNASDVNTWIRLSTHKCTLASKLKPIRSITTSPEKPYEFN